MVCMDHLYRHGSEITLPRLRDQGVEFHSPLCCRFWPQPLLAADERQHAACGRVVLYDPRYLS
jgi:hypothetical protein